MWQGTVDPPWSDPLTKELKTFERWVASRAHIFTLLEHAKNTVGRDDVVTILLQALKAEICLEK